MIQVPRNSEVTQRSGSDSSGDASTHQTASGIYQAADWGNLKSADMTNRLMTTSGGMPEGSVAYDNSGQAKYLDFGPGGNGDLNKYKGLPGGDGGEAGGEGGGGGGLDNFKSADGRKLQGGDGSLDNAKSADGRKLQGGDGSLDNARSADGRKLQGGHAEGSSEDDQSGDGRLQNDKSQKNFASQDSKADLEKNKKDSSLDNASSAGSDSMLTSILNKIESLWNGSSGASDGSLTASAGMSGGGEKSDFATQAGRNYADSDGALSEQKQGGYRSRQFGGDRLSDTADT